MRIALVSPYDFSVAGGVNSHAIHLAAKFMELGHEPRIYAPASGAPLPAPCPVTTSGTPIPWRASGSVARISLSLRQVPMVKRELEEHNFDIVHVHEPFMPVLPIQFLRQSDTAVNVGTFHAARESNVFYLYGRRLIKRWFRKLDGKIAVSAAAIRHVYRYFPGYYNIIPNGIDVAHFAAPIEPLPQFSDGKLNILFVGRPEQRKGLKYLLRAFAWVKERRPDTRLIVVGPGDFSRYRRSMRGVPDVVFDGYVSYQDLPRYHQSCHIFCAPSTGFESQGLVLLEAMASGRAIVAANNEGYAGVITHGVEGLLVPPAQEQPLADALLRLLDDPDRRRDMGEEGRLRAQEFSWDRVSQRILSYYERLIYEKRLTSPREAAAEAR